MTLTERRRRIRDIRQALGLATLYSGVPSPALRNLERSNKMISYAATMATQLADELAAEGSTE